MKRTLSACVALLICGAAPAAAQVQRGLADCAGLGAGDKTACEARNNAVTHCRLETDEARFAACVAEAIRNPPALRKPGFAGAGAGKASQDK